jgi:hypothetical protein
LQNSREALVWSDLPNEVLSVVINGKT